MCSARSQDHRVDRHAAGGEPLIDDEVERFDVFVVQNFGGDHGGGGAGVPRMTLGQGVHRDRVADAREFRCHVPVNHEPIAARTFRHRGSLGSEDGRHRSESKKQNQQGCLGAHGKNGTLNRISQPVATS